MRAPRALFVLFCLLASAAASAADYRVDMIVTLNRSAAADTALTHAAPVQPPSVMAAVDINDRPGLRRAGISILPIDAFGLQPEWQKLRNSRFRPVLRLAWRLVQRPTATAVRLHDDFRYRVMPAATSPLPAGTISGAVFERYRLDGSLLVQQSAGLRIRLDLDYTVPVNIPPAEYPSGNSRTISSVELATYSLHAEKRVNLGQIHFFDHPVLGVLLRVSQAN